MQSLLVPRYHSSLFCWAAGEKPLSTAGKRRREYSREFTLAKEQLFQVTMVSFLDFFTYENLGLRR